MYDVVCIGNALIDAFLTVHEASKHCRIDPKTGDLCIHAGEKIPLENTQFELGGNACNVSVGLSRLGLHTAFVGEFGNDAFAHRIKNQLAEERVSLIHSTTTDAPSSFAIGLNFKKERTLFVQHVERNHIFPYENLRTQWLYLSSMGEKWRHVYREVPALVKKHRWKLAFNPGTRQINAGKDVLTAALAITDILFVNKEEAEKIVNSRVHVGKNYAGNKKIMKELAQKLQEFGPKMVVLTDGERGSFVLDDHGEFHHQPIIPITVIEKTGAGDSFATGFLAAIYYNHDIQNAMYWGTLNAAAVVSKVGAQPGLLIKEQMERKMKSL